MRTAKLIIGIVSIVLFAFIVFQSCATGLANAMNRNSEDMSGTAGVILAFAMLIAGIVGIATRNSKGGGITAAIFYIVAALIGFISLGTFVDLVIWSVISLVFGAVFLIGSLTMKKIPKQQSGPEELP